MRIAVLFLATLAIAGCAGPNLEKANDELRHRNLQIEQDLVKTRQQLKDSQATAAVLKEQLDQKTPRIATLPDTRLNELFTVGRVELRKTSDAWDFDNSGSQQGFRVYVRTYTDNGEILPATGTVTVEAFDLALQEGSQRLGTWTFTPEQLKKSWYGMLGLNQFALNCPWPHPPAHPEITFKLRFVDALTNRAFEDQKAITVHLKSPATQPH